MEVEYVLEIDDALAFHCDQWNRGPKEHRLKGPGWGRVVVLALMVLVLVVLDLSFFGPLTEVVVFMLCAVGSLILLTLLLQVVGPRLAERNVRRIYKGSEGKGEFRHRRLTLSAEGVHSVSEVGDYITKWPGIEKVAVTDEHLFLYTSPTAAIIVPKRAFDDEWGFAEFVDYARRYYEADRSVG